MTRVRIALATTELGVGGAERCLAQLATGLDPQRFAPEVYALSPPPDPSRRGLVELLERSSIPVHFLNARNPWHFRHAISALGKMFQVQSPQIVQCFLFHANIIGTLAARRARVPIIVHGVRVADPRRWRHWLDRIAVRYATRIVCVSRSVAEFTRQRSRPDREKIVVIPNGVDLRRLDQSDKILLGSLGIPPGRQVIACVARLDRQKGLDWLLQSAPQFLNALPNCDLVIVGDGGDADSLRSLVREMGIVDRVHLVGWQPNVPGILKSSAAFVLPSRWEGMPNALLEAMGCGLPVIATRVEGVDEVVGCHVAQQLVAYGDTEALVNRLIEAISNPSLARQLGDDNRRHVVENFTIDRMIQAYDRLYLQLLANTLDPGTGHSTPQPP